MAALPRPQSCHADVCSFSSALDAPPHRRAGLRPLLWVGVAPVASNASLQPFLRIRHFLSLGRAQLFSEFLRDRVAWGAFAAIRSVHQSNSNSPKRGDVPNLGRPDIPGLNHRNNPDCGRKADPQQRANPTTAVISPPTPCIGDVLAQSSGRRLARPTDVSNRIWVTGINKNVETCYLAFGHASPPVTREASRGGGTDPPATAHRQISIDPIAFQIPDAALKQHSPEPN